VGFVLAIRNGEVVMHSYGYTRRFTALKKDPEKPGYPVPEAFEISHVQGPRSIRGHADLTLRRRDDLLDWLYSGLIRFIVRQVSHPVQYFFDADYEMLVNLGDGQKPVQGRGVSLLSILNRPPKDLDW
jgi:hypothetical protein